MTTGAGSGSTRPDGTPVKVAWKSPDGGASGTMSATLPDGRTFSGVFGPPRIEPRTSELPPVVDRELDYGGSPVWTWSYPAAGGPVAANYPGSVEANLQSTDGRRMRCRFQFNDRRAGIAGGGQGQCQLEGEGKLAALLLPS